MSAEIAASPVLAGAALEGACRMPNPRSKPTAGEENMPIHEEHAPLAVRQDGGWDQPRGRGPHDCDDPGLAVP